MEAMRWEAWWASFAPRCLCKASLVLLASCFCFGASGGLPLLKVLSGGKSAEQQACSRIYPARW